MWNNRIRIVDIFALTFIKFYSLRGDLVSDARLLICFLKSLIILTLIGLSCENSRIGAGSHTNPMKSYGTMDEPHVSGVDPQSFVFATGEPTIGTCESDEIHGIFAWIKYAPKNLCTYQTCSVYLCRRYMIMWYWIFDMTFS